MKKKTDPAAADQSVKPSPAAQTAEDEKRELIGKYTSLICYALDVLTALLLFIPIFGNGSDSPLTVSLSFLSNPDGLPL